MNLNDDQKEILINAGYMESSNKPGLWFLCNGPLTEYIDFRATPRAYEVDDDEIRNSPNNSRARKLLRQVKLAKDKSQSRLFSLTEGWPE